MSDLSELIDDLEPLLRTPAPTGYHRGRTAAKRARQVAARKKQIADACARASRRTSFFNRKAPHNG